MTTKPKKAAKKPAKGKPAKPKPKLGKRKNAPSVDASGLPKPRGQARGAPTNRQRHPAAIDDDNAYALALAHSMGPGASVRDIAALVNKRRVRRVYDEQIGLGASHEDATAFAKCAQVSTLTIRHHIVQHFKALRAECKVSAGMVLLGQLDAVEEEIERTYQLDEQIAKELDRSRKINWERKTRSLVGGKGEASPDRMAQHETVYSAEVAARADLFGRLQKNFELRFKLRDEQRKLMIASEILDASVDRGDGDGAAPTDLLVQLQDPARRKEAAAALYARELAITTEAPILTVMAPEARAVAAFKAEERRRRLAALRDLIRFSSDDDDEGNGGATFEMVFMVSDAMPAPEIGGELITVERGA